MSVLSKPHYHDEEAAYAFVEAILWPNGPECPKCGERERVSKMKGKSTRIGAHKCYKCRKPFTVKVGTIFESSHVPMHYWLQAFYLLNSSKKGISARQLQRTLKVQVRTAWFMLHRCREAMRTGSLAPMGGDGSSGVVEVDETFYGTKKGFQKKRGTGHKNAVLSLVERDGQVRSFHVADIKTKTVLPIVNENIDREARVMTDDALQYYDKLGDYAQHGVVNHSAKEYVRGDVHTNTVESYFSVFKRGMRGIYQHCDEKHLHRYLAEFDHRHNNRIALGVDDEQRTENAIAGAKGKRLTYRRIDGQDARLDM